MSCTSEIYNYISCGSLKYHFHVSHIPRLENFTTRFSCKDKNIIGLVIVMVYIGLDDNIHRSYDVLLLENMYC